MDMLPFPLLHEDYLVMDHEDGNHQMLQDQASGVGPSNLACDEIEASLHDTEMGGLQTGLTNSFYPPTDPCTLLYTPAVPQLFYPSSTPWPNQGYVDTPPSCGPSFYASMPGLSPIVGPDATIQRVVEFPAFPKKWPGDAVSISASPCVSSKLSRKPRFPTLEQFKTRSKPLCMIRDTRGFRGIGKYQERQGSEVDRKCFHCIFIRRKPCELIDGQDKCKSCIRQWASSMDNIIQNPQQVLHITDTYWFDIELTFAALFEFENDISNVLGPRANKPNPRLCSMSCDATFNPHSQRLQPVFISYDVISEAAKGNRVPNSPLNTSHMNEFIDGQIMDLLGPDLYILMTPAIVEALRCGIWLSILFNFDDNTVGRPHDVENPEVRSLILWVIYSIACEINRNLVGLYDKVMASLTNSPDPESLACALALFYESANSHQVLTNSSLIPKTLGKFLTAFHKRAECALNTVKRVRNKYGTYNCKPGGKYVQLRKILIGIQREFDPVMHLTYESPAESTRVLGIARTDDTFLHRQSQTQILNRCPWPLDDSDHMPQQHLNENQCTVPNPSADRLTEANLRCFAKGKPLTDNIEECASTCPVIEDEPIIVTEEGVSDNTGESRWDPDFGPMDVEDDRLQQWYPVIEEYQSSGNMRDIGYEKEFLEAGLALGLGPDLAIWNDLFPSKTPLHFEEGFDGMASLRRMSEELEEILSHSVII